MTVAPAGPVPLIVRFWALVSPSLALAPVSGLMPVMTMGVVEDEAGPEVVPPVGGRLPWATVVEVVDAEGVAPGAGVAEAPAAPPEEGAPPPDEDDWVEDDVVVLAGFVVVGAVEVVGMTGGVCVLC
jgi:hypothetical protein